MDWTPPLCEPLYCCAGCRAGQCTCDEADLEIGAATGRKARIGARRPRGQAVSALLQGAQRASALAAGTPLSPGGERRQLDRIQAQRRGILERLALLEGGTAARTLGATGTHDEASQLRSTLLRCLSALDDAEARILDGLYGRCEACGKWIPPRQLELEPTATRCAPCAASVVAIAPSTSGHHR